MNAMTADYGSDIWEPRPRCRETREIVYPDGTEPCPGCDDCCPDLPADELQRREQNEAIYITAVRNWFQKTDVA
jgi:hypothetical protein